MLYCGVDMGGTASRWALVDAGGALVARGESPGATGLIFTPEARGAFTAALAPARSKGALAGAYIGATGAGFDADPSLQAAAAEALGLPPEKTTVVNDMVLAWRAVWPEGGGHVVTAGTGSVGFSLKGGAVTLVGGRGLMLDDAGSGGWIGLQAVRALWRHIEETGGTRGAEALAEALFTAMGGSDWDATRRYVYGADRGGLAALARPVADAAALGDPLALALMAGAGAEIARLCRLIHARAGPGPVAVFGGALGLHPSIRAGILQGTADLTLTFPNPDAALAAAHIALTEAR
ncbi:N-acetylglucosamine kinase [Pararhodobacter aggregans]|uniref:N-acetylglucosamine kinase n=1 Tax=Pararhodobacter aggregans TaxID=404875 RepID=A0A2T7UPB8_9RHOB|nr:BadF/BadG/BcrA/BcrD ATPase family protein [Pararhodobacter aggregans]PTX01114.1 N-acetylglucosamine kinase-like BadF-type ATPase [Pararhodobacter aggregans]PVE46507.1 N-acetylglucosamine kinase [Pararhodobacter aggregans]